MNANQQPNNLTLPEFVFWLLSEGYGYVPPKENADVCLCGEPAKRTCPCGARVCHSHLYDTEGDRAGNGDGFCGECLDLIRSYRAQG